jgi:hypothetical protein
MFVPFTPHVASAERAGGSTPSAASPKPPPAATATLTKLRLFHRGWPPGKRRLTGSASDGRGPVRVGMSATVRCTVLISLLECCPPTV